MPKALVTVSDKTNLVPFVKDLVQKYGYTIYSSSGTQKLLKENGIPVVSVTEITQNPEAFGGRMKTISFELGSSLLYRRDNPQDVKEAKKLGILDIDLVICNLYPFAKVVQNQGSLEELIENIDIGGPLILRASAKNYKFVTTVCDPADYSLVLGSLASGQGQVSLEIKTQLGLKVWQHVAEYDQLISVTLNRELGQKKHEAFYLNEKARLRYGENPHQESSFFVSSLGQPFGFAECEVLQGKELSYNNYLDADAALRMVSELKWNFPHLHSVAVVKHGNPCGLSCGEDLYEAFLGAWESDKVSRFGGILCFSDIVTEEIAKRLREVFLEVIVAPDFSNSALDILSSKKNLRLIRMKLKPKNYQERLIRSIYGGYLIQKEDEAISEHYHSVTDLKFEDSEIDLVKFGEMCAKYLKSNAIALVGKIKKCFLLLGGGSGQPNRIDSFISLAWPRVQKQFPEIDVKEVVLVSDAFFPFTDMIDECHKRGIRKIVQPGGSIQDEAVIKRANEFGMKMIFTKMRHFRHG
jgi:phosphoribosylaminoimidazolecarboxamide formyltransferase/IMP cyclohydrolase